MSVSKQKSVPCFVPKNFCRNRKEDECLVKVDYDVISAGAEQTNYHDLPNTSISADIQHQYPRYPCYSVSGHVVKIGSKVTKFHSGNRVLVTWSGHRS